MFRFTKRGAHDRQLHRRQASTRLYCLYSCKMASSASTGFVWKRTSEPTVVYHKVRGKDFLKLRHSFPKRKPEVRWSSPLETEQEAQANAVPWRLTFEPEARVADRGALQTLQHNSVSVSNRRKQERQLPKGKFNGIVKDWCGVDIPHCSPESFCRFF